ncbi:piggyBac transposable element-derived protein 4-like [Palaemon carinicauda]|uniref:piggyBac transposable element-derived protein 4-like n=1 Tax=Palaemon carinicauda TaxID=392227 RepID=UPI0035B63B5E
MMLKLSFPLWHDETLTETKKNIRKSKRMSEVKLICELSLRTTWLSHPKIDFSLRSKSVYYPERKISIDENIIGIRGKTPHLRQYMLNKHHARFGIKVWCLCEARTGYTYAFEVYRGTAGMQVSDNGATYDLVMRLLEKAGLFHHGHHLGLDNYFSSPKLFQDLWQNGTTATGTVCTNRKGLPMDAVKKKMKNKEVSERRKGPLLCVTYRDGKKTLVLLSTSSKAGYKTVNRTGKPDKIVPHIADDYNHVMGGVDMKDTKLYSDLSERKTLKWNKGCFSLIGTVVLNSYILYASNTSRSPPLDRYKFMVSLVESIVQNYEPVKLVRKRRTLEQIHAASLSPDPIRSPSYVALSSDGHKIVKLPVGKKRNCIAGHPKRVRSGYFCPKCDGGICPECFTVFQNKLNH